MAGGKATIGNLLGTVNANGALLVALDGGTASATKFLAGDGSASAPSYSFASHTNYGVFYGTAGNGMVFTNNGGSKMALYASDLRLDSAHALSWSSGDPSSTGADVSLSREAANHLFQRNSTNAQRASWANTYTSSTSYSGATIDMQTAANHVRIGSSKGSGGGSALDVDLIYGNTIQASLLAGGFTLAAGTTATAPLVITNGTNLTTATANAIENDGASFYNTIDTTNGRRYADSWNYFRLTGSGSGISSIADFFGTNDGIPLVANGVYEIEWHCWFSQATAGTATWTIVTATTALANLNAEYWGSNIAGIGAVGAPQMAGVVTTSSSSTALPVTGTEANAATHYFLVKAFLTAGNGSSNTRLRLTMSAGTATPLINSYFRVRRLAGANTGAYVA